MPTTLIKNIEFLICNCLIEHINLLISEDQSLEQKQIISVIFKQSSIYDPLQFKFIAMFFSGHSSVQIHLLRFFLEPQIRQVM